MKLPFLRNVSGLEMHKLPKYANSFLLLSKEKSYNWLVFLYYFVQIRDFEYSSEAQESRKQELEKLVQDQENLRSSLLQWCYASYGEVIFIFSLICLSYL